jgi:hypothetical protein
MLANNDQKPHTANRDLTGLSMAEQEEFRGTLFDFSETGYEASPWAIQVEKKDSGNDLGLVFLRPGDTLTVTSNGKKVFDAKLHIGKDRGGYGGVYWYPWGIDSVNWESLFTNGFPAHVVRGVPDEIAEKVSRIMTWYNYLLEIEGFRRHDPSRPSTLEVSVACYFPDPKREPTRLQLSFEDDRLRDIRPL